MDPALFAALKQTHYGIIQKVQLVLSIFALVAKQKR